MDPQQTPNPAPYNPGQQPQTPQQPAQDPAFQATSMQDESQAQVPAPQPGDTNNEVTVDFNQDAQNAGQAPTQSGGTFAPGTMPSLGSENPVVTTPQPSEPYAASSAANVSGQPDANVAAPSGPEGYGVSGPAATDPMGGQPLTADQSQGFGPPIPGNSGVVNGPVDTFQDTAQSPAFGTPAAPGAMASGQPVPEQQPMQPQPAQPVAQMFQADQQPPMVPATAPAAGIKADKKTIFILAGVAVVLIVAIAILIFM